MALITIGTNLLDTSDIALVAPRGSLSTVYLADSLQVESALSAAAQAAAVNAAAAATLTTAVASSNFGSCYINGLNVQRVMGDGGAGTTWYLRGGPGAVVCPSTDLTVAQALIAAASGAPNAAQAGNVDASALTTSGTSNVDNSSFSYWYWLFVPDEESTTQGTVHASFYGTVQATAPGAAVLRLSGFAALGMPFPFDDNPFGVVSVTQGAATLATIFCDGADAVEITVTAADTDPNVISGHLTYRTGAA